MRFKPGTLVKLNTVGKQQESVIISLFGDKAAWNVWNKNEGRGKIVKQVRKGIHLVVFEDGSEYHFHSSHIEPVDGITRVKERHNL